MMSDEHKQTNKYADDLQRQMMIDCVMPYARAQLNIRAAKVLNLVVKSDGGPLVWFHKDTGKYFYGPSGNNRLWKKDLRFHSSYDWAMMGLHLSNVPAVIHCIGNYHIKITETDKIYLADTFEDFPFQITLSWVETLEGRNERERQKNKGTD